jgi:cysteinyl-tRNA synthetase
VFDVLRRYLAFEGLQVAHVANVTDIDDQIIARAAREGRTEAEVAAQFEASWWEAMEALGELRPTAIPHATEYVADMVTLVADLVERGKAYETDDGVYLSTDEVPGYGLLARQPLDSLKAGARVATSEQKRSPLDFALFKKAKAGEPSWDSPWGPGRPGWHTECVVMSLDLLGEGFDLHGGGQDLMFPHHENERAQAVADGRDFAHHWMHHGWVMVGGEKMSKSLGNFTTLTDLIARSDTRAYRLLVLQAHYRSPIEVTMDTVAQAEAALKRLDALARRFALPDLVPPGTWLVRDEGAATDVDPEELTRFEACMDDDLDTPAALGRVFELVTRANSAADAGDHHAAQRAAATVAVLCGAMGLSLRAAATPGGDEVDAASEALRAQRDEARAARDWARADALRDQLTALGWTVEDGAGGTVIRR